MAWVPSTRLKPGRPSQTASPSSPLPTSNGLCVIYTDLHTHSTVPEPEPEQHLSMFDAYREHNTLHLGSHAYHACGLRCFVS